MLSRCDCARWTCSPRVRHAHHLLLCDAFLHFSVISTVYTVRPMAARRSTCTSSPPEASTCHWTGTSSSAAPTQYGNQSQPSSRAGSASSSRSSGDPPQAAPQQAWSVFQLFGWRQAFAAAQRVRQPIATRLQITGVSLSLATWRVLPPGNGDQQSAAAAQQRPAMQTAASPAQPSQGRAVAFTAGSETSHAEGSGSVGPSAWRQQQRDNSGEASRRKQRLAAAGLVSAEASRQLRHSGGGRQQQQCAPSGPSTAEHLLLQQWGAEVELTVLPPGERPDPVADAQQAAPPAAGSSHKPPGSGDDHANSSLPSSSASFRSWSIPAGNGAANGYTRAHMKDAGAHRPSPPGASCLWAAGMDMMSTLA